MGKNRKPESESIEWKSSWHDEYFKWLCGYANVRGGHLFIGVNDDGYVIGCKNYRKLLEDLPNRIISKIGIVPNIRFHSAKRIGVNIRYGTDGTAENENMIPEYIRMKEKNLYAVGKFVPDEVLLRDLKAIDEEGRLSNKLIWR